MNIGDFIVDYLRDYKHTWVTKVVLLVLHYTIVLVYSRYDDIINPIPVIVASRPCIFKLNIRDFFCVFISEIVSAEAICIAFGTV